MYGRLCICTYVCICVRVHLYNAADITSNEQPQAGPGQPGSSVHSSDFQAGCNRTPRCVVLHRLTRQTTSGVDGGDRSTTTARSSSLADRQPISLFTDFLSFDMFPPGRPIFSPCVPLFACTSLSLLPNPPRFLSFSRSTLSTAINRKQPRQWNLVDWLESRRRGRITSLRSSPGCFRGGLSEWAGTTAKI